IAGLTKQAMAESAEQLLAGTGWLPSLLRTERPPWLTDAQPEIPAMAEDMTEADSAETVEDEHFAVAAE
ncbi:chromosome partitioning protein ParB, partial [bacterium]|nr:chromosome partitioning protein ParB [bacterium]